MANSVNSDRTAPLESDLVLHGSDLSVEQRRRVSEDNLGIIVVISP